MDAPIVGQPQPEINPPTTEGSDRKNLPPSEFKEPPHTIKNLFSLIFVTLLLVGGFVLAVWLKSVWTIN